MRGQWLKSDAAEPLPSCGKEGQPPQRGLRLCVRGWVGIAALRILLDLTERSLLGCRVLFQPGGMLEQIGLASLIPFFLPTLGERSPFAWMDSIDDGPSVLPWMSESWISASPSLCPASIP